MEQEEKNGIFPPVETGLRPVWDKRKREDTFFPPVETGLRPVWDKTKREDTFFSARRDRSQTCLG